MSAPIQVLVVDREPQIPRLIAALLGGDYAVDSASSAAGALLSCSAGFCPIRSQVEAKRCPQALSESACQSIQIAVFQAIEAFGLESGWGH